MPRRLSRSDVTPGETRAARDFFAGRFAEVAAATFDHPAMDVATADVAFAVGALTFLGRFDDALACYEARHEEQGAASARTREASRFFLGVARARSGDFAQARAFLVDHALRRLRGAEPWTASFVLQGIACYRYFTGKYRAAARHAARAARAAHGARLAYTQMLATDLRGHALVQLGRIHAGTALLEQAQRHAERLGLGKNAFAIACSIAIYRAKTRIEADAVRDVETLLAQPAHDSYSRRMLLTQVAVQYALRGRATDARAALADADRDALKLDARRAKVTSLLARLYVERFARGADACAEILDQAVALTDEGDVAFRAELLAFHLWVGKASGDAGREARALEGVRALRARSEHHVLDAALEAHEGRRPEAFAEDEIAPLLRAATERDARALGKMLALGIVGPVPELLGLRPGRRVILLAAESALIIEDQGDVMLRSNPPRWVAPLLRILASGNASKERIVAAMWGLRRYQPDRHDSLVRTTIHRLRTLLEPRGEWVAVTADGYGLTVPLHAVGAAPSTVETDDVALDDDGLDLEPPPVARARPLASATVPIRAESDPVLVALVGGEARSVPEIARAASLSSSSVLRALRRHLVAKRVTRTGYARATRYRLR